tara:strand:- start:3403 stop:4707 length:1305 start_codon:yes stop_codon:yes gene_type:complete
MTINYPDYPANWRPLANDAADSAWQGSPMSQFAKGGRAGCKPFMIVPPAEDVAKYAKGGLASEAKNVANAGVGGDSMVIHINRDEYNKLCKEWGEPTINPHTGMPQWTPFWKQSWFAPVAALVGTAAIGMGGGEVLGSLLGSAGSSTLAGATGIGALGTTTVGTLAGNAAIGAGIGALTGGARGALTSGLLAGAGTIGASALGNYLGTDYSPAPSQGATEVPTPTPRPAEFGAPSGFASPSAAPSAGSGLMNAVKGFATDPNKMAAAALVLGDLASGSNSPTTAAQPTSTTTDPNLTKRLAMNPLNRQRTLNLPGSNYYNYGSMPQQQFYAAAPAEQQQQEQPVQAAHGGPLSHYVQGGGTGRSDSIPAKLSDGEYVIDAETVALLGDGSSKAGAQRLDQFRANIRKQKGKALSQGKFSPNARAPEQYLMGGRA